MDSSTPGRATGIGGVFRRARDPAALQSFYADELGLPTEEGMVMLRWRETDGADAVTLLHFFEDDTDYFGSADQQAMVNLRVDDLDALLARLRAAGTTIDDDKGIEGHEGLGRFAWITDPEGNRIELWEPVEAT